ncbi:MAG: hypothetical protein CMK59_02225 [Proteobacteria bacterium]|nr:hypothetical protein [Pseudomonadota bacterium]
MASSMTEDPLRMLFVLPPSSEHGEPVLPSHHPIMTASLAAVARKEGAQVNVIDAALLGLSPKELSKKIKMWRPDWIGFLPYEYRREFSEQSSSLTVAELRSLGWNGEAGLLNSALNALPPRRAVEKKAFDFACFGDSEPAVAAFARRCEEPSAGVIWQRRGYLEENPEQPEVEWEDLPTPAWDLFKWRSYQPTAHRYRRLPTLPVFASRSCPYGCDFCPQSLFNPSHKHQTRSVEAILRELKELIDWYGIRDVEFYDPTFGVRRSQALELCQRLIEKNWDLTWSAYTRCDLVDEELIQNMKAAGCHTLLFGVESGDEEVLERTGKELRHADIEKAFNLCKKHGLRTIASFILGLPKESEESLQKTLDLAKKIDPTYAQFHLARAFFEHEEWKEHGTVAEHWEVTSASVNGQAYCPTGLTERQLQRWLIRSYVGFYIRPQKLISLMKTLHSTEDILRVFRGVRQVSNHLSPLILNSKSRV